MPVYGIFSFITKRTLMSEQEIEQKIQNKELNALRLTPELIDAVVKSVEFHVFESTCLTI